MAVKPLEIQLVITQSNLADTKEAADQKPIKFVLKRRGAATDTTTEEVSTALFDQLDDEELLTLKLIIEEKAGVGYTLDDRINPPSEGIIDEDGVLIHPVSSEATGCVITFKDGSQMIELSFAPSVDQEEEWWEEEELGYEIDEELDDLIEREDDEPSLCLIIPEKANQPYTINDGVNPESQGVVDEDGLLVHPISSEATECLLKFENDSREIKFSIS